MLEKGLKPTSSFYFSKPWLTKRFSILTPGLFIGMFIIWNIYGCSISTTIKKWKNKRALKLNNPNFAHFTYNLTHKSSSIYTPPLDDDAVLVTHLSISHLIALVAPLAAALDNQNLNWILVELKPNYTSNLISRWLAHGGEPCKDSQTVQISIPCLDDKNSVVELSNRDVHEFAIKSLDEEGKPRCLGGDYFEIDISGESWMSIPPISDFGNGFCR